MIQQFEQTTQLRSPFPKPYCLPAFTRKAKDYDPTKRPRRGFCWVDEHAEAPKITASVQLYTKLREGVEASNQVLSAYTTYKDLQKSTNFHQPFYILLNLGAKHSKLCLKVTPSHSPSSVFFGRRRRRKEIHRELFFEAFPRIGVEPHLVDRRGSLLLWWMVWVEKGCCFGGSKVGVCLFVCFGLFWFVLVCFGLFWFVLVCFGLVCFGLFWVVLGWFVCLFCSAGFRGEGWWRLKVGRDGWDASFSGKRSLVLVLFWG